MPSVVDAENTKASCLFVYTCLVSVLLKYFTKYTWNCSALYHIIEVTLTEWVKYVGGGIVHIEMQD